MTIDVVETSKTPDRPPAGLPKQPNMKALERIRETGRHAVGDGLYLQVANGGARSWLYRYQQHGRRHDLGIGPFPAVTLAMAREAIIRVRQQLHRNEDPLAIRRAERAARPTNDATDFARRPNASAAAGDRPNELIGIVLVTHGNLAHELIAALEHVVGPQQGVVAVCIGADDDMEKQRDEILESAKACDTGDGWLC